MTAIILERMCDSLFYPHYPFIPCNEAKLCISANPHKNSHMTAIILERMCASLFYPHYPFIPLAYMEEALQERSLAAEETSFCRRDDGSLSLLDLQLGQHM